MRKNSWTSLILLTWTLGALSLTSRAAADQKGEALLAAAQKGDLPEVKRLLDAGADVNARNRYASTPLFFACDRGHLDIIRLLIERGADLNVRDNFYNFSALTVAMIKKRDDVVALMIEKGVDVSDALKQSVQEGDQKLFDVILAKGKLTQAILDDALLMGVATRSEKNEAMIKALEAKGAKTASFPVDEATLKTYEGRYTEGEVNRVFAAKDGKLSIVSPAATTALVPVDKDRFKLVQAQIDFTFERDEKGNVASVSYFTRGGVIKLKKAN